MKEQDPFTKILEALWELLTAGSHFKQVAKPGNLVKYMGSERDPIKQNIAEDDVPEFRMVPTGIVSHLHRTSNSSYCMMQIEIQVASGTRVLDTGILPIVWDIYRQMANWQSVLGALTWNNVSFIRNVRPPEMKIGVTELDLNRGIPGWSCVWAIEVDCWFTTLHLIQ